MVGQVDKKFIAAVMPSSNEHHPVGANEPNGNPKNQVVVLFDQHAVEERLRLEALLDGR